MHRNAQSSFQKLNVDNSCQKTRKIRYYIFEVLPNFIVSLYFVPNILSRIVEMFHFILALNCFSFLVFALIRCIFFQWLGFAPETSFGLNIWLDFLFPIISPVVSAVSLSISWSSLSSSNHVLVAVLIIFFYICLIKF